MSTFNNETIGNIRDVIGVIRDLKDRSVSSLSEYSKKTLLSSRVYIENSLSGEEGLTSIMKFCNHLFSGLVFTTIGMNNMIAGGRTVRDMAAMISTEDFHSFLDTIKDKFGDKNVRVVAGMEDFKKDVKEASEIVTGDDDDDRRAKDDDDRKGGKSESKEVKLDTSTFSGRLIEVNVTGANGEKVPLYFYVQLVPYTVPTETMKQFIDGDFKPDFASRWVKFKAGEISFWKDFIFEADLVAKRRKALKADKDGILREIEDHRQNSLAKTFAAMNPFAQRNHNAASSIIIVSRRTITQLFKDQGLQFERFDVRQKIMQSTMSLMLVVFDPNYNTVNVYMNGIQAAGTYSLDQINEATKNKGSKDGIDLKTLMTMLGTGNAPRF